MGYSPLGPRRVRYNSVTEHAHTHTHVHTHTHTHTRTHTVAQGSKSECFHEQGGSCMTVNSLTLEVTGHVFTFSC